jgi:hypothetical protein
LEVRGTDTGALTTDPPDGGADERPEDGKGISSNVTGIFLSTDRSTLSKGGAFTVLLGLSETV